MNFDTPILSVVLIIGDQRQRAANALATQYVTAVELGAGYLFGMGDALLKFTACELDQQRGKANVG